VRVSVHVRLCNSVHSTSVCYYFCMLELGADNFLLYMNVRWRVKVCVSKCASPFKFVRVCVHVYVCACLSKFFFVVFNVYRVSVY
jgi:hypothetical protein